MSEATHSALRLKPFIGYKATNAFFQGVWGTAYVGLMTPLPPDIFSAGGIGFSLGTWVVALGYSRLFNLSAFFHISLGVEIIALVSVLAILIYPAGFGLAAGIYLGFQLALIFGSYLGRLETLVVAKDKLKHLDIGKSVGALLGLAFAAAFYQFARHWLNIENSSTLVHFIHYPLLIVQTINVGLLLFSFDRSRFNVTL